MSAYGTSISRPNNASPSKVEARIFSLPEKAITAERAAVVFVPYNQDPDRKLPKEVEDELRKDFNIELAAGRTYPQSDQMSESDFRNYFLAYDLIVGYFVSEKYVSDLSLGSEISSNGILISREKVMENASLLNAKSLASSYYIKPNYPSRSSHICNGGFVVPESSRGVGIGGIAGKSFLYYAPRCDYRASIFNLVYETNQASVKIWKRLGFTTIGIIPSAGLLKTEDGKSETYVDAHVVHGDFEKIAIKD